MRGWGNNKLLLSEACLTRELTRISGSGLWVGRSEGFMGNQCIKQMGIQ